MSGLFWKRFHHVQAAAPEAAFGRRRLPSPPWRPRRSWLLLLLLRLTAGTLGTAGVSLLTGKPGRKCIQQHFIQVTIWKLIELHSFKITSQSLIIS